MLGSAYGILIAVENVGLSIGPLLVTVMHETGYKKGYFAVSMLNLFEALGGAAFAAYLAYYDYSHSQVLMANSRNAVAIQKAEHSKHKAAAKVEAAPVITGF